MFLELLLALAIIMFIAYKVLNFYFKKPLLNQETQKVISEQDIDVTTPQSMIDSTKNKLQDIQDQRMEMLNKIADEYE